MPCMLHNLGRKQLLSATERQAWIQSTKLKAKRGTSILLLHHLGNSHQMALNNSGNIALLIDGDNASPKIIIGLLAEIANYGTASVRRIYGDWTSPALKGWKACLLDHSITPIQQFAYTTGKNATDGAMIIDAMDLLYTGRFSNFCIVSSDSDFTRLAARIREQGVTVFGFGERKTPHPFVAACDKFVYFDVLNVPMGGMEEPQAEFRPSIPTPSYPMPSKKRKLDQKALDGLRDAINSSASYEGSFANLAEVGHYLHRISPDLNARNYGYSRLREFVEASDLVDVKSERIGDNPPIALVRLKSDVRRPLGYS